jgi:type IV pilus assembly protein PilB
MSRLLPPQPNLEHLKKEAKKLHKSHTVGDPDICRLLRHLSKFADLSDDEILLAEVSLTDMQYALAMDYGFVSWKALRQSVRESEKLKEPVGESTRKVLLEAIKGGASDVHIEPFENTCRIRFRIDGFLHEYDQVKPELGLKIGITIKSMAGLDVSESRMPQQGFFKHQISKSKSIDFRVITLPVLLGEKISLRILDPSSASVGLEHLGFEPEQLQLFREALHKNTGLLLVTGPSGSGRTVSLYNGLILLNKQGVNISTVEDPVEIILDGVDQSPVNAEIGMDYAQMLNSVMKHDPDIVYVADLPDIATANVALKAAQSGHLILSAMIANSAPEAIIKLKQMGVPTYQLATSIILVVAQRLARRLCHHCRIELNLPEESLIEAGFSKQTIGSGLKIYGPGGCDKCIQGYRGRIGIFEVVKISQEIAKVILDEGDAQQIDDACQRQGFLNLIQSGLKKVAGGETSLEEIQRITTGEIELGSE